MFIDISKIDPKHFVTTPCSIAGERCTLIKTGSVCNSIWDINNLHYRSCIINSQGMPISCSYPKFFNLNEREDLIKFNGDLTGCSLVEKIDGSTLIVSKYKDELIIRTRGSINTDNLKNNKEIQVFKDKYKDFFNSLPTTTTCSYVFEWVSPENIIVIRYYSPELYLTNIINHEDYSLDRQGSLDAVGAKFGFPRPTKMQCTSFTQAVNTIKNFVGMEGMCLYHNNDQNITKIKSKQYLMLHSFRSQCNFNTLISLYFQWEKPSKAEFIGLVINTFDYECYQVSRDFIDALYDRGLKYVGYCIKDVKNFLIENKTLSQKEFAAAVQKEYVKGKSSLKPLAFLFRSRVNPDLNRIIKNLLISKLKNL